MFYLDINKTTFHTCEISKHYLFTNKKEMTLNEVLLRFLKDDIINFGFNISGYDVVWIYKPELINEYY